MPKAKKKTLKRPKRDPSPLGATRAMPFRDVVQKLLETPPERRARPK